MSLHREEALETLEEENVLYEAGVLFRIGDDTYCLGLMEGEDMRPAEMQRDLNRRHKTMREECLERIGEGEAIYSLLRRE